MALLDLPKFVVAMPIKAFSSRGCNKGNRSNNKSSLSRFPGGLEASRGLSREAFKEPYR